MTDIFGAEFAVTVRSTDTIRCIFASTFSFPFLSRTGGNSWRRKKSHCSAAKESLFSAGYWKELDLPFVSRERFFSPPPIPLLRHGVFPFRSVRCVVQFETRPNRTRCQRARQQLRARTGIRLVVRQSIIYSCYINFTRAADG